MRKSPGVALQDPVLFPDAFVRRPQRWFIDAGLPMKVGAFLRSGVPVKGSVVPAEFEEEDYRRALSLDDGFAFEDEGANASAEVRSENDADWEPPKLKAL